MSEPSDQTSTSVPSLERYFDNSAPTIFDELLFSSSSASSADPIGTSDKNAPGPASAPARSSSSSSAATESGATALSHFALESFLPSIGTDSATSGGTGTTNNNSNNDSNRDFWIPSERTQKVLRAIATSTPGATFMDREYLTMPGLVRQEDTYERTKEAIDRFLGEEKNTRANVLGASDVTQDERGVRNLIQTGNYRSAVNLLGCLLTIYGQGYGKINHPSKHTPHSLQLWYARLSLLAKLRDFQSLEKESQPFGSLDQPDMYFAFYPELYGTRRGSMAPFGFRLLLAEIPALCGRPKRSLDLLFALLATVRRILALPDCSRRLWEGRCARVQMSLANVALQLRNYSLTLELLAELERSLPEKSDALRLARARVHLFLGDLEGASACGKATDATTPSIGELVNNGLAAVAQNLFQEAYNCFNVALAALDSGNVTLINNMSVCLLYTGQLKEAVNLLENAVTLDPVKSLQEPVLLNLCTLYELHTTHCKEAKLHLLRQLCRYKGDDVDIACLKLSL